MLFLKNGLVVRSQGFEDFREFGNPINQLERLNDWMADELIYIDITREGFYDLKRDDHKIHVSPDVLEILRVISRECFMPLTFGGRIRTFDDVAQLISGGADKVVINTAAYQTPSLITQVADHFGRQCMVLGIDVKKVAGRHRLFVAQGTEEAADSPEEWAKKAADLGAGEIFLNSIDRDGTGEGYDLEIIDKISRNVRVPVIACGGAGSFDDFEQVLRQTAASAAAAGNIFNFTENAYIKAKKQLTAGGCSVKPASPEKYERPYHDSPAKNSIL